MTYRYCKPAVGALGFAAALMLASAGSAPAQQPATPATPIKLGIVTFLTGPAAAPFGMPGRNGAEIVIEALNAGNVPAPYNTVGLGGTKIDAKYVDEAGSTAQVSPNSAISCSATRSTPSSATSRPAAASQ